MSVITLRELETDLYAALARGSRTFQTVGDINLDPGQVIHCGILDAMKTFFRQQLHEPANIHLTPLVEALLQHHLAKEEPGFNLRRRPVLFGMKLILDAPHFKLD